MKKFISFIIAVCFFAAIISPATAAWAKTDVANNNAVWTWWFYPQCVTLDDTTFYGFVDDHNNVSVGSYNMETGDSEATVLLTAKSKKADKETNDHNSVSVTAMYDGHIMCVYTKGHQTAKSMMVSVSDEAASIDSFQTVELRCSGNTGYAQVVKTAGEYYLFYRVNNNKWAYRHSRDGRTWTDEVVILKHETKVYCLFRPTDEEGVIRIAFNCHKRVEGNNSDRRLNHIRGGFIHTEDGQIYGTDNSTLLGCERIMYTDFPIVMEADARTRLLDLASGAAATDWRIIYGNIGRTSATYYLYENGNKVKISESDSVLTNSYPYGASFGAKNRILVVSSDSGSISVDIFKYLYRKKRVRHVMTLASVSADDGDRLFRPISSEEGTVMWLGGRYSTRDYHDYNTSAYIYYKKKNSGDCE